MAKRANGEGTIYQRKDKRWCGSVTVEAGGRKAFYGATRKEVHKKVSAALKDQQDGLPLVGERLTVSEFFAQWLKSIKPSLKLGTWTRYEQYVRVHIVPVVGTVRLSKLTPQDLQRLYANRIEAGLSPTTAHHIHAVAHKALSQAERWGLIARNVATLVDAPRPERHEMMTLSSDQARTFLKAAEGERLEALYVLALSTGMRQGELLALRWQDVGLELGHLRVSGSLRRTPAGLMIGQPKTTASRRRVELPCVAIEALRAHRTRQNAERLRIGAGWENLDLVFASENGRPVEATNVLRRSFRRTLGRAMVPRIRFHDLRHTAATLMMERGVHPKIVSEMLGHSQVGITLDLYSHVTPTMQRQATTEMDAVFASGLA